MKIGKLSVCQKYHLSGTSGSLNLFRKSWGVLDTQKTRKYFSPFVTEESARYAMSCIRKGEHWTNSFLWGKPIEDSKVKIEHWDCRGCGCPQSIKLKKCDFCGKAKP